MNLYEADLKQITKYGGAIKNFYWFVPLSERNVLRVEINLAWKKFFINEIKYSMTIPLL